MKLKAFNNKEYHLVVPYLNHMRQQINLHSWPICPVPDAWPELNFTFWEKDSRNSLAKSTGGTKKIRKNALPSNEVLQYIGKLPKINGVGRASHLIIFCPVDISGFPT